jgi:hypothetical protein
VLTALKALWPDLVILNGRPRHPQSQGSVERANEHVKDMLSAWLSDNNTKNWPEGLRFVQLAKNTRPHRSLGMRSPYEVVFGGDAKLGCDTNTLPERLKNALLLNEEDVDSLSSADDADDSDNAPTGREEMRKSVDRLQEKAAASMMRKSVLRAPPSKVGDTVSLLVDKVDRGPTDPPSLVCVVLQQHDDGSVTLGCRAGRLAGKFHRNCYKICPESILSAEEVPDNEIFSVRNAVAELSKFNGHGYTRCGCYIITPSFMSAML